MWKFADEVEILETQQISSEGRVDEVSNMGSYKIVFEHIEGLMKHLKKDDKFIAQQCRNIICGAKISDEIDHPHLLKTITALTYLLFGTETSRNPGQLIASQMALDLIIEGDIKNDNWEEAIDGLEKTVKRQGNDKDRADGGYIPMTMKEAVKAMRGLYEHYPQFLPFPYKYDNDPNNKNATRSVDLMEREANLFERWIELKQKKVS